MAIPEAEWRAADPLEPAEQRLLECAARGMVFDGAADLRPQRTDGQAPTVHRATVRAAVLRSLLSEDRWAVDPRGVRLCRVRIRDVLDFESVTLRCALSLADCDLDDSHPAVFDFASVPLLLLRECRLGGLSAGSLSVEGDLDLRGSRFAGCMTLQGARIGGALLCRGARVGVSSDGNGLMGHGMNVRLSVHLSYGFTSDGGIAMPRAEIGGELICRSAHFGVSSYGNSFFAPGLKVGGAVYFSDGFQAQSALVFPGSSIGGQIRCEGARIGADADGNSLVCDGLRTGGSVHLDMAPGGEPFTADGAVRLAGGEIIGSLTCRGSKVGANRYGNALVADELRASVAVLLEGGFTASGAVRLAGAQIGGQFRCDGAHITGADYDGYSLFGNGMKVGGPAHLDQGFSSAGAAVLTGADFGGLLSLSGARLGADRQQCAVTADGIKVDRDLIMSGAAFAGGVILTGAVIGGSLILRGAALSGSDPDGNTLVGNGARVSGSLAMNRGFSAVGAVLFAGADIGGAVNCQGAQLGSNNNGDALVGDGIKVGRDMQLDTNRQDQDAFTANGSIQLNGSEVAGFLSLGGAQVAAGQDTESLAARGVKVGGSVYLDRGFTATSTIVLSRSSIGGSVACHGATLGTGNNGASLVCERTNIGGGLILDQGFAAAGSVSLSGTVIGRALLWEPGEPARGPVNLEGAQAQYLIDNWDQRQAAFWPDGRLRLAGFTYQGFGGEQHATAGQRLNWIRSQYHAHASGAAVPPFVTQPYRQLADVYRRAGQEDDARTVEIALRRDLRRYGNLNSPRKLLNWLLDVTIRYGFQTGRALIGILALYMVVFIAFLFAQHQGGLLIASNLNGADLHPTALRCVTGYPCFYPAGYAFDLVVPLINIRQADYWQVNGHHPLGWIWVSGSWLATALGWFLATLLVVGYSGLARKE
jgi:hypothetical protein